MRGLLALSGAIDRVNEFIGKWVGWLILVSIFVSAGNAIVRKMFNLSSNAWLELQWYLFGAAFMLAAAYTLKQGEHIRIDIVYGMFSRRVQHWIDLFGHVFFLTPFVFLMVWYFVPYVALSYRSGEGSPNAGGLIVWPAKAILLAGFFLLSLQAISEIVKKIAVIAGTIDDPTPFVPTHPPIEPEELTGDGGAAAMIVFIAQNMAPIMFASLVIFLLVGYPVAFSLAANGLLFFLIGVTIAPYSDGAINLSWPLLHALPDNFYGSRVMSNDVLLAIPFFTFMGIVLERSGMAEDLLDTVGQLFGPVRGGLAYAVIFVGALLAATTGVVAASVIAMGLISLPIMLRYGYDRRAASGVIAASGTLAQIIPPSLVLIVLADQLGRSVGDMYAGAIIPGLVLTGLYTGYVLLVTIIRPKAMPALPLEARTLGSGVISLLIALAAAAAVAYAANLYLVPHVGSNADIWGATTGVAVVYAAALLDRGLKVNLMSRLAQQVIIVLIPPLALIFLVLGTIFLGIATPTEGGAMGSVGALVMAAGKGRLTLDVIKQALASTTRLSSFVLFILIGARTFSLTFYGVSGNLWVEHLLTSLPGGEIGFLIGVNILVFLLAFFLDFFELAFILVPLLAGPADKLGIDLIWFGVLLGVNMQTSFMHPPFGFALFYLRSVAPRVPYLDRVTRRQIAPVSTGQIYWGAVPFVLIQVIMVGLTIAFPQMVMHYKNVAPSPPQSIEQPATPPAEGGGQQLPAPPGTDLSQPPSFGTPPADGGAQQQPAPPANDLSQPPSFGTPPADGGAQQQTPPPGTDLSQPPSFGTPPANGGG